MVFIKKKGEKIDMTIKEGLEAKKKINLGFAKKTKKLRRRVGSAADKLLSGRKLKRRRGRSLPEGFRTKISVRSKIRY